MKHLTTRFALLRISLTVLIVLVSGAVALAFIDAITVDRNVQLSLNRTVAQVSGLIQCTAGDTAFVDVTIFQSKGKGLQAGSGNTTVTCDGTVQAWSVLAPILFGTSYSPGPATLVVSAFDATDGDSQTVSTTGHLHN